MTLNTKNDPPLKTKSWFTTFEDQSNISWYARWCLVTASHQGKHSITEYIKCIQNSNRSSDEGVHRIHWENNADGIQICISRQLQHPHAQRLRIFGRIIIQISLTTNYARRSPGEYPSDSRNQTIVSMTAGKSNGQWVWSKRTILQCVQGLAHYASRSATRLHNMAKTYASPGLCPPGGSNEAVFLQPDRLPYSLKNTLIPWLKSVWQSTS